MSSKNAFTFDLIKTVSNFNPIKKARQIADEILTANNINFEEIKSKIDQNLDEISKKNSGCDNNNGCSTGESYCNYSKIDGGNRSRPVVNNLFFKFNTLRSDYIKFNSPVKKQIKINPALNAISSEKDSTVDDCDNNATANISKDINTSESNNESQTLLIQSEFDNTNYSTAFSSSFPSSGISYTYIDIFNHTNLLYKELVQNLKNLQNLENQRIKPKFDDGENKETDDKIKELVMSMTKKVKLCEDNVRKLDENKGLKSPSSDNSESDYELKIKENIKLNLIQKIKEFTFEFKSNEQKYMKTYKELVGDNTESDDALNNDIKKESNFLNIKTVNPLLSKRSNEIDILLSSISDLSSVFKDLKLLVQEQGTILDRIDYNIDTASINTKKAKKHIVKANEAMKGNCFRNSILTLLVVIFIESILVLLKLL